MIGKRLSDWLLRLIVEFLVFCTDFQFDFGFLAVQVKQFHPDVNRDGNYSDSMIRRVIQAYEVAIHL